jgi:hypothetical protein
MIMLGFRVFRQVEASTQVPRLWSLRRVSRVHRVDRRDLEIIASKLSACSTKSRLFWVGAILASWPQN